MAKLDSLTSLRFFAALWVVLFHARDQFNCLWELSRNIVFSQAVTFFFVLSGFILAYVYPEMLSKQEKWSYLLKRFGRIWPLHALCLVAIVLFLPLGVQLEPKSLQYPYPLMFFTNLFLVQSWILGPQFYFSFNPPAWSLSNEIFFYGILPLLLVPLNKKVISIQLIPLLVCLLIVLSLCNFANALDLPMTSTDSISLEALLGVNPMVRVFDFCLGASLAFLFKNFSEKINSKLNSTSATLFEISALFAVFTAVWNTSSICDAVKRISFISAAGSYWLRESGIVILFFAALIFIFALERGYLSKVLSAPYLVLLGEISFAIYLWHFPLIKAFYAYMPHQRSLRAFCFYLMILFCLSFLSYKLWESPVRSIFVQIANKEKIKLPSGKFSFNISIALILLGLSIFLVRENIQILDPDQLAQIKNLKSFTLTQKSFDSDLLLEGYELTNAPLGKNINLVWTKSGKQRLDQSLLVQFFNQRNELFHQQQLKLSGDNSFVLPVELPERAYNEATKMTLRTNMGEESFILEH
ncbi:MAG: acyltransferase [Candidatus Melainabacteria bacterium]|nr:acyltransferase [Candidatus Melainabacteria bacterium]